MPLWIASRSLSPGARSREPLASSRYHSIGCFACGRNDDEMQFSF